LENNTHDMMDELLVKYLAEEATPPEQELVEEWLMASAANRHYFQHFELIWNESKKLAATITVDENKAWHRFQRRIKKTDSATGKIKAFGWWRIAASILIVGGIAWLTSTLLEKGSAEPETLNIASVSQVKRDTLPDGSIAVLNKHSEISYPAIFRGKTRSVRLKGEAFFNVKADKKKPFIIAVNDVEVKVIGTSFNIRSLKGLTEIIVETGIVQVTKGNEVIELRAGERVSLEAVDTTLKKEASEDKLYNYYVSRTFVCDNTPLWKLVEKLNEAYGVNIRIGREALRKMPLNVTFADESLDVILSIISETLLIKVSKEGNEIVLH